MNRTIKQSFMKWAGNQCRLDAVIKCLYYRVSDYFRARALVSEKVPPGLGRSKRMDYYRKRLVLAVDLFEDHREDIKVINEELGMATVPRGSVRSGTASASVSASADDREDAVYEVDLSCASCTCPGVLMVPCSHILAVAMRLPRAAERFCINCETIRGNDPMHEDDISLEDFLRERSTLEEQEPGDVKAPDATDSAAPVGAPFLEDHEGECAVDQRETYHAAPDPSTHCCVVHVHPPPHAGRAAKSAELCVGGNR